MADAEDAVRKGELIMKCRGCGAPILWIKMQGSGKKMPVDEEPVQIVQQAGGHPYMQMVGSYVTGYIAGDALDDPDTKVIQAYRSHFATCPKAGTFRRREKA